jgi:hypothetical protein
MLHEDEFDPTLGDEFVSSPLVITTTGKNDGNVPCLAFGGATFRFLNGSKICRGPRKVDAELLNVFGTFTRFPSKE